MSSVPWKNDEPWKQPWHFYSSHENHWRPVEAKAVPSPPSSSTIKRLALHSWNIDFMLPYPDSRMQAAIRHLESLVKQHKEGTATVIFFQECLASDIDFLRASPWIQQNFAVTDTDSSNWQSGYYGTTTLIDNRLSITDVFRVHFEKTRMQRDGLFVDLSFPTGDGPSKRIRLCNTHLESLALEPPLRPAQMELCAKYMHAPGIDGAAVAGDFNAIQDFDRTLHSDNDFQDAFLALGGAEDDAEAGHTWGQQAATTQRERFGTSRMDKVFYCGEAMKCMAFERVGAGVEVEDETERKALVELGFDRPWITDHLGVKAVFEIE